MRTDIGDIGQWSAARRLATLGILVTISEIHTQDLPYREINIYSSSLWSLRETQKVAVLMIFKQFHTFRLPYILFCIHGTGCTLSEMLFQLQQKLSEGRILFFLLKQFSSLRELQKKPVTNALTWQTSAFIKSLNLVFNNLRPKGFH